MNIVDRIAADLNDADHIAWSVQDITDWAKEGTDMIVSLKPELFKTRKVVALEPCTEFQTVDCCDFIFRVVGESDADGNILRPLRRAKSWVESWPIPACKPTRWGGLKRYAILGDKDLYVAPAPPSGEELYVVVECTAADDVDINALPASIRGPLIQWVLFRARSMDAESSVVAGMGEQNFEKMKDLLGIKKAYERSVGGRTI